MKTTCTCSPRRLVTNRSNPLRLDPTRTLTLRASFMARLRKIFLSVQAEVEKFVVEQDALGLKNLPGFPSFDRLINQAREREFAFRTDAGKLEAFNSWFLAQVNARVLFPDLSVRADQPWTTEYVESAYRRGLLNAYLGSRSSRVLKTAVVGTLTQAEFLRRAFAAPEARSKIQLLATRSLESLKGVTAAMASKLNFILAQGILDGRGPVAIAREMTKEITALTQSRALMIARTEIIHAHAEGQLDAFERLGVLQLGVKAEWVTAGDDRVCPQCLPLEGQIFTVEEARGKIPLHPNCRCSWTPYLPPVK